MKKQIFKAESGSFIRITAVHTVRKCPTWRSSGPSGPVPNMTAKEGQGLKTQTTGVKERNPLGVYVHTGSEDVLGHELQHVRGAVEQECEAWRDLACLP